MNHLGHQNYKNKHTGTNSIKLCGISILGARSFGCGGHGIESFISLISFFTCYLHFIIF